MAYQLTQDDHRRTGLAGFSHVYAVFSRRSKGVSIGVNLNPDRICNFDCSYCQVDRSKHAAGRLSMPVLKKELAAMFALLADGTLLQRPPFTTLPEELRRVRDVAFSGDGEPTSSPAFPDAVDTVLELKRRLRLDDLNIVVITNASLLHRPTVVAAIEKIQDANGEIWAKLDSGTAEEYAQINRSAVPFQRICSNIQALARRSPIVIQTMVLETGVPSKPFPDMEAYTKRIQTILDDGGRIRLIQLYSVARRPARGDVFAVDRRTLTSMAAAIASRTGVEVDVYPGSRAFLAQRAETP